MPEADLDLPAATELIAEAWPDLRGQPTRVVGVGWDNLAVSVGAEVVVRIARRAVAAELLWTEHRVLPGLAPVLPLPASVPVDIALIEARHPFPFCRYAWLRGRPASDGDWSLDARAAAAPVLGAFLRALHGVPVSAEAASLGPVDEIGRMDLAMRLERNLPRAAELREWRPGERTDEAFARMGSLLGTPAWEGEPVWCHGDLYARHVLVDENAVPVGVIDWGDVHLGDPAVDLSLVYGLLPPSARSAFWAAYGPVDEATRGRARFRSLHSSFCLIHYGHAVSDEHLLRAGQIGWDFALAPEP